MKAKAMIKKIPLVKWFLPNRTSSQPAPQIKHGPEGIKEVGHRQYVGGCWDEIGRLQFDYLVSQGLRPHHYLLDIACGSLRAGIHFIPYLEAGHYLGIDKEADLIQAGIERELSPEVREAKGPVLLVDGDFAFERFGVRPDYALAQSLFTHLPTPLIEKCLRNLRGVLADDGVFFATFFESSDLIANPDEPYDHGRFDYTRAEMEQLGQSAGWRSEYIGDWNHPRGQIMMRYRPA
ncbi:MAG: methyltransferase [Isosphaeraceae bacterium]